MNKVKVKINGSHAWSNLQLVCNGVPVKGITSINYTSDEVLQKNKPGFAALRALLVVYKGNSQLLRDDLLTGLAGFNYGFRQHAIGIYYPANM